MLSPFQGIGEVLCPLADLQRLFLQFGDLPDKPVATGIFLVVDIFHLFAKAFQFLANRPQGVIQCLFALLGKLLLLGVKDPVGQILELPAQTLAGSFQLRHSLFILAGTGLQSLIQRRYLRRGCPFAGNRFVAGHQITDQSANKQCQRRYNQPVK